MSRDCPPDIDALPAAAVRAERGRSLPVQRPGQPQPPVGDLRPGAAAGPEVPAFTPGLPRRVAGRPTCSPSSARSDVLLHHPFHSFAPVLDFLRRPPPIRRCSRSSRRCTAPATIRRSSTRWSRPRAAGKDVTVVVELRARFDEEANIGLADRLQEAGAHVVYGVVGFKTHAKMLLVVRREAGRPAPLLPPRHRQLPPGTARGYTDFGLFTCDPDDRPRRARAVPAADQPDAAPRAAASCCSRRSRCTQACCEKIDREAEHARAGQARAHHRQDERADRAAGHRGAVPRLAGRRADRPDRARRSARCGPAFRACPTTSACARSSAASSSTRASTTSATTATPELYLRQRRLDGAQLLPPRRGRLPGARADASRSHPARPRDSTWPTTRRPGRCGRDGSYTRCAADDDAGARRAGALLARYAAGSAPVIVA